MARPLLAVIGDIHYSLRQARHPLDTVLSHIAEAHVDGILVVGDLVAGPLMAHNATDPMVRAVYFATAEAAIARVAALGVPLLWVPGNHDLPEFGRDGHPSGNIDGGVAELAGLRVAGIGGAGPERFGFCYEWSEAQIQARPEPDCDVLLCHCPPRDTALDLTRSGEHVGSAAIRARALRHRGVLVCGHIHESPAAEQLGDSLMLNAGGLGAPYGAAQLGFVCGKDEVRHVSLATGLTRRWQRRG